MLFRSRANVRVLKGMQVIIVDFVRTDTMKMVMRSVCLMMSVEELQHSRV